MIIRKIDLPVGVNGITVLDENGDYNVYLNARISYDSQAIAFRHEVEHIRQGHFYKYEDVSTMEEQAKIEVI